MIDYCEFLRLAIKSFRKASGFTQSIVAQALGISRTAYTNYEYGLSLPELPVLKKLAALYRLPLSQFFDPYALPAAGAERKRLKKTDPPTRVEQLTPEEKLLIALLRTTDIPPSALLPDSDLSLSSPSGSC